MRSRPIEEISSESMTPERLATDFVRGSTPVVLRGLAAGWPACGWNSDKLTPLSGRRIRGSQIGPDGTTEREVVLTCNEFARAFLDDNPPGEPPVTNWYFQAAEAVPEIIPDMPVWNVHRGRHEFTLFAGQDSVTWAHFHALQHAVMFELRGRKRVTLFPPADSRFLYPHSLVRAPHFNVSRADVFAPDFERFPMLAETHPVEATLEPGDALFIPVYWWHAVRGTGRVLSLSLFWGTHPVDHRFPGPVLRSLAGTLRWYVPTLLRSKVEARKRAGSG